MARIDDFKKALEIGKEEISKKNPLHLCRLSGSQFIEKPNKPDSIQIMFLNRMVNISWPDLIFSQDSDKEIKIKEKILILHYLNNVKKEDLTGELIAYQEIPSARFYLSSFNARSRDPFIAAFGENPDKLPVVAQELFAAQIASMGDVSITIQAFPKTPITFVIWRGDEEFPPNGTILFDSSIKDNLLSAEDISELVSMIVYPLIAKAR
ncbi:unnamed protein product [marine sediment metagenome]|uniref:DUF3786 domain-containing protein n=1 Tax=marine sediment metagenome TaxID=412755 RepID=X0T5W8_9ZZZZ